ncbi:MAG TPA: hypothetical protein VMF89_04085 [Polyangiales bacterium]|nr:hypothetical protein [Polyangiales bacterium]
MSRGLQLSACFAALASALIGCAADAEPEMAICTWKTVSPWLMHTAFDGVHEFSVTPNVPSADSDSQDSDPVDAATVRWHFDPDFFVASEFPGLAGAVKLTTRKAGETDLIMTASTRSGVTIRDTAKVVIAEADPNAWSVGEARYQSGLPASLENFLLAPEGEGTCGLPYAIDVPTTAACVSCHNNSDEIRAEYTPTQTAAYTDEELLNIVLTGQKPAGGSFISPQLTAMQMPDCIFGEFHTFEMTPLEQRGLISKLRSVPPRVFP